MINLITLNIETPVMVKESNSMWGDYWSKGIVSNKTSTYIEVTYQRDYHAEWEKLYLHYRNTIKERFYFFGDNMSARISTEIQD